MADDTFRVTRPKARVLIVDDDASLTFHLSRYLARIGFEVEQVNESRRALAVARAFQPDAVILDYLMPDLDGAEVAWQFHSDPALNSKPLLICSGNVEAIVRSKLTPRDIAIVAKPFPAAAVWEWIREAIDLPA